MNSEDKFKERLRAKIESKEFSFEEAHWKEAAAYIDKQRRGGRWRVIALLLIIGGVISSLLLIPSGSDKNIVTKLAQKEAQPSASPHTETINQKTREVVKDTEKPSHTILKTEKLPAPEPAVVHRPMDQKEPENNTIPHAGVPDKTQAINAAIAVPREEEPQKTITERPQLAVSMTRKGSEEKYAEEATRQEEDHNPSSGETLRPEYPGTETPTVALPASSVINTNSEREKVPALQNSGEQESIIADSLHAEEVPEKETELPPVAGDKNSALAAVTQPTSEKMPDTLRPLVKSQNYLSLEAGTDLLTGWNDAGLRDAAGVNPVAGIQYFSPVTSKLYMSFGIQYRRTGHLGAFTHRSKSARYSFGEESVVTEITPRNLHYLGVPLRVYFNTENNHIFGAAYSVYYLLDVESKVYTYNSSLAGRNNERTYLARGYADGFRIFDSQISLFYRRTLCKNFGVHGELFFGLNDIKDDGFFGTSSAQRNTGLRLMFFYNLPRN